MRSLFRGLMVPVSFVLFLALFGATAVAVVALGPVLLEGMKPEDLRTLIPAGAGTPSPWILAAGADLVATLLIGMIAMFIAEHVYTVWRFTRAVVRTAFWFAVIVGGGLAAFLWNHPGEPWPKLAPAALAAGGLLVGAIVCGILLGKPFLWWVSERPAPRRRRSTAYPVEVMPAAGGPAPVMVETIRTDPTPPAAAPAPATQDEPSPAI